MTESLTDMMRRAQDLLYKKKDYVAAKALFEAVTVRARAGGGAAVMVAPSVKPIDLFWSASSKEDNDSANRLRESYLARILDLSEEEVSADSRIGVLREGWRKVIHDLRPAEAAAEGPVTVVQKGGRRANYDFLIKYGDVGMQPIEFKYGADGITGLPQFLSLAEKALPFPVSYAEYFYEHWIGQFVETDPEITAALPPKADYLRMVYNCNYGAHPFFTAAYARSSSYKKEKATVVNASITAFLEEYGAACNLGVLTDIFLDKQLGKVFVLWNNGVFHIERFTEEDLRLVACDGIHGGNCMVVRSATHTFRLLLRWKNHKGVLYPAWQISLAS